MTRQLSAELRKLTSVRATWWLAGAAITFAAVSAVTGPPPSAGHAARALADREIVFIGAFHRILITLIGARLVTDEFHHGTIVSTFTATPQRVRVMVGKATVSAGVGAVVGAVAMAALIGAGVLSGRIDGAMPGLMSQAAAVVTGSALAGGLWGVIGVAVGAVVRHPVAASVGIVAWLLAVEGLVAAQLGRVGELLPGQSGFALALAPSLRQAAIGGVALTGAAAAGLVVALALVTRRDVR